MENETNENYGTLDYEVNEYLRIHGQQPKEESNNTIGKSGQQSKAESNKEECKSAKNLRNVGILVLIIGIILSIILFFSTYIDDKVFNPMCLIYTFATMLPSLVIWAFAEAVADIVDYTKRNEKVD